MKVLTTLFTVMTLLLTPLCADVAHCPDQGKEEFYDPFDPCTPCAPVCGTDCGLSVCALGIGVIGVMAIAALIIAAGSENNVSHSHSHS